MHVPSGRPIGLVLFGLAVLLLSAPEPAGAGTFAVTRFDDPLPGGCTPWACSLREAVIAANASPGSTITLPAGTYELAIPGTDDGETPNAAVGDLDILVGMTITGAGAGSTTIKAGPSYGAGIDRVFDNHSLEAVLISGLAMVYGVDAGHATGGCLRNNGVLTLDGVHVWGCYSPIYGGGIASYHTLTLHNSFVTYNEVGWAAFGGIGGGVFGGLGSVRGTSSTVNISNSYLLSNVAGRRYPAPRPDFGGGFVSPAIMNGSESVIWVPGFGAGFANAAVMNISESVISLNWGYSGGGGFNTGTTTIRRSRVQQNRAGDEAAGIRNHAGTMTISDTAIQYNQTGFGWPAPGRAFPGGGLLNASGGTVYLDNTVIVGNSCGWGTGKEATTGGGLNNREGTLTIRNGTIYNNVCGRGAGIDAGTDGTVNMKNTVLGGNRALGPGAGDLLGTVTSEGYNLIQNVAESEVIGDLTGNIVGVDPLLLLAGGDFGEYFPHPASPVIDAGDPAGCRDHLGELLATDGRGYPRPSEPGGRCDIGAVEAMPSMVLWSRSSGAPSEARIQAFDHGLPADQALHIVMFNGPGWMAESYSRNPDGTFHLLVTTDNYAYSVRMAVTAANPPGTVQYEMIGIRAFTGPGPGWRATSYFANADGSYQLLWTTDNQAMVWTINADHTFGSAFGMLGPGAGWRATSYFHARDGSHRVLWTTDNLAHLWTITPSLGFGGAVGLGFPDLPGNAWTATSCFLNADGSWNVLWTGPEVSGSDAQAAHLWTITAEGSFQGWLQMPPLGPGLAATSYSR